ncbi:methyl-accepting chemotaxis sensory transducer [Desulfobulbus propionicus DSM 2032]|uniref:Methyl-accepting chemotaxis sensory transducer n=1 Tax=Desulfobulbus propionicus (strain ATCC 33891 / DSM 2032 / VKM B-1956 / 1pr3) TaxID=577650 RepID=A0A7U4DPZ3_DESPD|nr:HAMP domain-containing methyl-accepting chemotaxis protein [Desulfobulbus propionicus]ADW18477.1 methyl-accepting chemotaxis sensory transducer [Desulfobulbus propionicus DSM 2032]
MEEQVKQLGRFRNPFSILIEKFNIRGKLMLSFSVMIALTLAVIVIAIISQHFAKNTIDELVFIHGKIAKLSLDTDKTLKIMNGYEKDLFLNYSEIGINDAKDKYLSKIIASGGDAYQKLYEIQQLAPKAQEKSAAQNAMDALNNYLAAFIATVNILELRVDPEFGELTKLQQAVDAMRKSTSTIEVPKVQIFFQNLLYQMQQYMLHPEKSLGDKVLVEAKLLGDTINASIDNTSLQTVVLDQLADFSKWFADVVATDETIKKRIFAYQEAVKQADPVIASFLKDAISNESQAVARMENTATLVQKIVIGAGLVAVLLGIAIAFGLARGLTRQVNHIMDLLGAMGMGDFNARTEVVSNDELGQMAIALNAMLDNITVLIQSQEERDAIQESIMKLMGEIGDLTQGDLTARAEVTEDMTGAIADSFNTMAEQFGDIVRQVKSATLAVDGTASDVSKLTVNLATKNIDQTKQVRAAIQSITEIAESIRQVSHNAVKSAKVSLDSQRNAREGAEAVEKTNIAMDEIREQINETARSIKRLGESSMEIGNVIEIINNIADRTSILALNASIQAAMAGDAGHGFAVVAEEVQRLAESSSNSTKQIEVLIKSIQSEIKDVSNRMDESIGKVVQGSQLADGAYGKLQEIESVSNQLASLIESITQASTKQVQLSESVVENMVSVGEVSNETSRVSQETATLMKTLNKTAHDLRESVEVFKVDLAPAV